MANYVTIPKSYLTTLYDFVDNITNEKPVSVDMLRGLTPIQDLPSVTLPTISTISNIGGVPDTGVSNINFTLIEGFCPIVNFSSNCYMNTAIQLLFSMQEMRLFLKKLKYESIDDYKLKTDGDCRVYGDIELTSSKNTIKALKKIYDEYEKKTNINFFNIKIGSKNIYQYLLESKEYDHFESGKNEDIEDFLGNILDKFECIDDKDIQDFYSKLLHNDQYYYKCANNTKNISITAKDKIDKGEFEKTDEKTIKKIIETKHRIINLYAKENTIQKNLDSYEEYDNVELNDYCGKDDNNLLIQAKIKIPDNNKYLIIVLKRFSPITSPIGGVRYEKNDKEIESNSIITVDNKKFKLKGIALHEGNLINGHYTYLYYNKDKTKTHIDDTSIKQSTLDESLIKRQGYVFLYEKLNELEGGARKIRKTRSFRKATRKTRKHNKY